MFAVGVDVRRRLEVQVGGVGGGVIILYCGGDVGEDVDAGNGGGKSFREVGVDNMMRDSGRGESGGKVEGHAAPDGISACFDDEENIFW